MSWRGFEYRGERFGSLSEIARRITGTRWSGPLFFGLKGVEPSVTGKVRRCAIYTRKSSEEGLDQTFNSLDAQREACEAYIRSQAHEGWKLVKTPYDDGGFSGGNLERPALQRLLVDLSRGLVDVIVVYKIDRLTRSLADFARIVETLDRQGASFVSITQQFNTTTSMGRLTLNVLLSFAQFEREVTGERIRDKIAASKRKGMWMGGNLPLGYDVKDRQLVVNDAEAETVSYLSRSIWSLEQLRPFEPTSASGIVSKVWMSSSGRGGAGQAYSRGALYYLLRNPIYVGRIAHRGASYDGQHPGHRAPGPVGPGAGHADGQPAGPLTAATSSTSSCWPVVYSMTAAIL